MESNALKRLPVGIQTYEKIVEQDCLYIDKTDFIPKMMALSNYVFLCCPRRFGKSLLVSTLQAYFEGRRELFKGCYIDSVEKDWTAYPVLRFDMSQAKHLEKEELERYLHHLLDENEARFGLTSNSVDTNLRLATLIQAAYRQTGRKVVVLIDEYDAPLLDVTYTDEQL